MTSLKTTLIAAAALLALPGFALAGVVVFDDGTFDPANYSDTTVFTSGVGTTINADQCAACGDPGQALQILISFPGGAASAAQGYVNNTFSYDPLTQGAITALDASVDKDTTFNPAPTGTLTSTFRPLIEQGGNFYLAAIPVTAAFTGGTTGYVTASGSGLTASSFVEYDFSTGAFGSGNPNFAGGPLLFGVAQISSDNLPEALEVDYDNLNLTLTTAAVPEPATWAMMLVGCGGIGAAMRSRRKRAGPSAFAHPAATAALS